MKKGKEFLLKIFFFHLKIPFLIEEKSLNSSFTHCKKSSGSDSALYVNSHLHVWQFASKNWTRKCIVKPQSVWSVSSQVTVSSTDFTIYASGLRFSWNQKVFTKICSEVPKIITLSIFKIYAKRNFKWMTDIRVVFMINLTIYTQKRSFQTLSYEKKKQIT